MNPKVYFMMLGIMLLYLSGLTQTKITYNQSFDGATHNFVITPAHAWMIDSTLSASGQNSCRGFVPKNVRDSIMLVSPIYDLSAYAHVYLRFTHICKVAPTDVVSVEYKEVYVGAQWTEIPNNCYEGSSQTYRKQRTFNDESYVEWADNDLYAVPDNSWWKKEGFDITQDVAYARVQFRFKIIKGNELGSQFAWGWLIDDFELSASLSEIKPPVVEFAEPYTNGTVYGTGPFQIKAKAAKRTLLPLKTPILRMKYITMNGVVTLDSTYMTAIEGDSIWIATIPQQLIGTRVNYSVYATDTMGNDGIAYSSYLIGRKLGLDSNSVALNAIDTPKKRGVIAGVSSPIVVTIENRGLKTLSSATIQLQVNGVTQASTNWTGSLAEGFSTNVTIGSYIPRLTQYDTITAWVTYPNGVPNTTSDSMVSRIVYGCTQILGGDYIVGPSGQFSTINDALYILNLCGTAGNVTLKVQNGTYQEGIRLFDLNEITGAYDVLTITSFSGNAADVVLKNDSTQTMVIDLARSHNVVIKNVTIDATSGTVGVRLTDTCYNIEVSNCVILLDTVSTVGSGGIYKGATTGLVDRFRILNNTINGGYYGIYMYGVSQTSFNTNLSIVGNKIKNSYYTGVYLYYNQFSNVTSNEMTTRSANMGVNYYGIYAYYNHGNFITKNKIHPSKAVSDPVGMQLYYLNDGDSANMILIANNDIKVHAATRTLDAITMSYAAANVMHNSILRTGPTAGAGIWLVNSPSILTIKNNNIATEAGYPIYLAATSNLGNTWFLDYNNYYSSSLNLVGYAGGAISDMTTWKNTTNQDSNSVNILPTYADISKDLKLAHYTGFDCPILGLVPFDRLDSARVGITTAMGAYTPSPLVFDAAVLGAANWSSSVTVNQSTTVTAVFMNVGSTDTLKSVRLNWSVNGVNQTPYNWTGVLLPYASTTANLGTFMPVAGYNYISMWLTLPNGKTADMNLLNDTITVSAHGCTAPLSGNYTIGGIGADFASISEANTFIGLCSINGPVVFKLASGNYSNVSFTGTYKGSDSINTVTFTSAADNADSVIITGPTNGISITNVSHLTIRKITVDNYTSTYGILISDSCSNLEIRECKILSDPTTTATKAGIRYNNTASMSDNIRIIGNQVDGGYYGIYIYGMNTANYATRIVVDSNIVTNQYYYGIYFYYSDITSVSHNIVTARDENANANYSGIYTYYCNANIIGNKIKCVNPSISNPYGMNLTYLNCFDTIPAIIANNDVIVYTASTYYGMYFAYAQANIYHNSILTLGTGAARGLYLTANATNICFYNIYNNNFISLSAATSTPIYNAQTTYYAADYNNYYSSGTYLGYVSQNSATLADMQMYGQDLNSVNVLPDFVDFNYDLRLRKGTGLACPLMAMFTNDREGKARNATTFMGAYVETDLINNVKMISFIQPTSNVCLPGDTMHVRVVFMNRADSVLKNARINWRINGISQTPFSWTGNLLPDAYDTVYLGSFIGVATDNSILVYSSLPNGQMDDLPADDTLRYSVYGCPSGSLSGTYTVGMPTSDFTTLNSAIFALSNCGISGPVVLRIADGLYDEIAIMTPFPGGDSTNTVLFTSVSGNKNNVVIGNTSVSGSALVLSDAANLRFEYLTFGNTSNTIAGVKVQNTLTDVKFDHCNLYSTLGANATAYGCFYRDASTTQMITGLTFNKCVFQGGYHSMYMINGGQSAFIYGDVKIDSCQLIDATYYGIFMVHPDYVNFTIRHNYIANYSGSSTYYAIRIGNQTSYTGLDSCIGNEIRCTASGTNYGIYIGQAVNVEGQLKGVYAYVANNEIIINGGSSTNYGLYWVNIGYIKYFANSVHINGRGGTSYGFYMSNNSTGSILYLKYNNFYINNPNGTAYSVWHSQNMYTSDIIELDYNNYYTSGTFVAATYTSLKAWQLAIAQDYNSVNEKVNFINYPIDLHTDGKRAIMPLSADVPVDFEGSIRISYTNMGCYEDFVCSAYDAKMQEIVSPTTNGIPVGVSIPVSIKIANAGSAILDSVEIQWMANGILQVPFYWKGALSFSQSTPTFTIGNFTSASGLNTLTIWTENPNGFPDGDVFNDTLEISLVSCDSAFLGTYTVGTSSSDFKTMQEVVDKLVNCSIFGPVVFELASGSYSSIDLPDNISGSSSINTVTFKSASGNASTVLIGANDDVAVSLSSVSHLRFLNVTIGSTTASTSYGVKLAGYCENIEFYGCNIYANNTRTNAINAGAAVYYENTSNNTIYLKDISFVKNNISGGYYNVYLYYPAGSATNTRTTAANRSVITIDSNVLSDAYCYGIYSYYYAYYPSVSNNTITARSSSDIFYGMYMYYYNTIDTCRGNKIYLINKTTGYGIHAYSLNRNSTYGAKGPCVMANNEIISTNGTINYGVYRVNGQWNFVNNSIYLSGTTNYGIYFNNSVWDEEFTGNNNIVVTNGPSGSANYPIYTLTANYITPAIGVYLNYNDYYTSTNTIAYAGSAVSTLSTWQSTYGQDMNSVDSLPSFTDVDSSLALAYYDPAFICFRHLDVMTDINNNPRTILTFMGAYTIPLFEGYDLSLEAFAEPLVGGVQCFPDYTSIKVEVYNPGIHTANFLSDPITLHFSCVSDSVNVQTNVIINSGSLAVMNKKVLDVYPSLNIVNPGMYKLKVWMDCPRDEQAFNDTITLDYYVEKSVLPYDNNFSAAGAGLYVNQILGDVEWDIDSNVAANPVFGTQSMLFHSSQSIGSISQSLFTSVSLQGTYHPRLQFWYLHDNTNPTKRDQMEVEISQDGGETFTVLQTVFRYHPSYTTPTWVPYQIDLSNYTQGSCIIISFVGYSYGGGDQAIDRIHIVAVQDMKLTMISPDFSTFSACDLSNKSISVVMANQTNQPIPYNVGDSITVKISGADNRTIKQSLVGKLEGLAVDTFLIATDLDFSVSGNYNIVAYTNAIDSIQSNDTDRVSYSFTADVALNEILPIEYKNVGDTVYATVKIVNTGTIPVYSPITLELNVSGKDTIWETLTDTMEVGDTISYVFIQGFIVPSITSVQPYYFLNIKASIPCDAIESNNKKQYLGNVNFQDISVYSIIRPTVASYIKVNEAVYVQAEIYNRGTFDSEGVKIYVQVDSSGVQVASFHETTDTILADTTITHTFTTPYYVPSFGTDSSKYRVTVFIEATTDDLNLLNDTLRTETYALNDVGIVSAKDINWSLGQNQPNPVQNTTVIPYSIPQDGTVNLKIVSINGQILYQETIQAVSGNNRVEVDIDNLSNGIYYYSMEYNGQTLVKKMNVLK